MVALNPFHQFVEDLAKKVHNLSADTLKIALTNTAPAAANTVLTDITQITAANGYVSGGSAVTVTSCEQTAGVVKLILADLTITASGGSFGPFRYVVLYNDTAASDQLICWWDYGSALTITAPDSVKFDFDASTGALTIGA